MTTTKKTIETKADSEKIYYSFYTTNFKEMAELDVSSDKGNYIVKKSLELIIIAITYS
jgi:hypothetical protein